MRSWLLLACLLASSTAARAQHLPSSPRDATLQLAPIDHELYRAQRRHRMWIAAGVGVLAASAAHLGVLRNPGCEDFGHFSVYSAGVVGAVGLTFTLNGGIRLLRSTPHSPATRGQKIGASLVALGAAAGTSALLMTLWMFQSTRCNS